jgi:hypothetical protein
VGSSEGTAELVPMTLSVDREERCGFRASYRIEGEVAAAPNPAGEEGSTMLGSRKRTFGCPERIKILFRSPGRGEVEVGKAWISCK